jgi:hypothetical protein
VTVYGLDLDRRVQADVLSASITSINERVNGCSGESKIWFDATIGGLVIDGHPYNVELDTKPFRDNGTFAAFAKEFSQLTASQPCQNGVRASIVSNITPALKGDKPDIRQKGFTIEVPNFGLIHLGEVMLTVGKRGINLLRVELGRTLEDLAPVVEIEEIPSPESGSEEQRPTALAFRSLTDTLSGGYTVAHATGNGTDFGPPP